MITTAIEPCVEVLNAADGHLTVKVGKDPKEHDQAKKVIGDMLKRGYAIFVELEDGTTARVKKFDAKHEEYIVMDVPETVTPKKAKKAKKTKRVPLRKARATGVAPTAGG